MRRPICQSVPVLLLLPIALLACGQEPPLPPPEPPEQSPGNSGPRGIFHDLLSLREALEAEDLPSFLGHRRQILEVAPRNLALLHAVARGDMAFGRQEEAFELLRQGAELGGVFDLTSEDWGDLQTHPGFETLRQTIEKNQSPAAQGRLLQTLDDAGLFPEGIAHDPEDGSLYLSSLKRHKIVRVSQDGTVSDFKSSGQDGLGDTIGLAIDAPRRKLWAVSMADSAVGNPGTSAVFEYDLTSEELVAIHSPDDLVDLFLNDLAVAPDGRVFVTDSNGCRIFQGSNGAEGLRLLLTLPGCNYLNGLAVASDPLRLYATHLEGITLVDLETLETRPLVLAPGIAAPHGDGLYFVEGDLILVQNQGYLDFRIARYVLDSAGETAERVEVLHRGLREGRMPYTAAPTGDRLFVHFTADFSLMDLPDPPPSEILVLDL